MITSENRSLLHSNTSDIEPGQRSNYWKLARTRPRQLILTLEALRIKIGYWKVSPEVSLKRLPYTTDRVRMNLKKVY